MRKVLKRVGQSTLEYVIVLTAIVAAILFAAVQFIKPGVNRVYGNASTTMEGSGGLFANKIGGGVAIGGGATGGATTGGATTGGAASGPVF